MIEYEQVWMRAVVLVARNSMLYGGTAGGLANAVHRYVLTHLKQIFDGLRRELDDADTVACDASRVALQRVALGKAVCGLDALEQERRLADERAALPPVPCLRFSIACRVLQQVLDSAPGRHNGIPELPSIAGTWTACERGEREAKAVPFTSSKGPRER